MKGTRQQTARDTTVTAAITHAMGLFEQAKDHGVTPYGSPSAHRALAACIQSSGHLLTIAEEVAAGRLDGDIARQFLRAAAVSLPRAMKAVETPQNAAKH